MALIYFVVAGLIPIALLFYEYKHAETFAKLYGHFFLYPLLFGWAPIYLAGRVFPRVRSLLDSKRRRVAFWAGLVLLTIGALGAELNSDNIAPWELKSSKLAELKLEDHFEADSRTDSEKVRYQALALQAVNNPRNWSLTRYSYFASFTTQVAGLLLVFYCSAALMAYRIRLGLIENEPSLPAWYRGSLSLISTACAVCLLYTFCRIAFNSEKKNFFPTISNETSTWVILGLFLLTLVFLAACLWLWVGKHLQPIVSLAFGGTSVVVLWKYPEILPALFGRKAGFIGYISIALGLAVCLWAWLIFGSPLKDVLDEKPEGTTADA
jgi:uncharacterized membrane protein YidH (DUF202 family)